MAEIRIERIVKTYGAGAAALDDVSLTVRDGEFMVLLGPSGCGKTSLLRMIAGFERPDAGTVSIGGRDMAGVPPRGRGLAMVFQSYALFPHLRVKDNIAFGLRMRWAGRDAAATRAAEVAELMEISRFLDRFPSQLSGGQRQRVAVARALAADAAVILMDEPLSNLDALLRLQMRAELKRLLQQVRTTTVYVTHDQVEALSMGDRTAVMRAGRILQVDDPMTVYDRPAEPFVARFIGNPPMNLLEGRIRRAGPEAEVEVEGRVIRAGDGQGRESGAPVLVGVRAENLDLVATGDCEDGLRGEAMVVEPLGSHLLVTVAVGGQQLKVTAPIGSGISSGDAVCVRVKAGSVRLLDPDGDEGTA